MNVEMVGQAAKSNVDMDKIKHGNLSKNDARIAEFMTGYSLDITGKVTENAAYGKEELLSANEIAQKAGHVDVTLQRNYMAVMSNSMSEEDFAKLRKDGFNPTDTKIDEQVTSLDRLKAKLAAAGKTIVGFNDDLSADELTAALGNAGMAISVENALKQADIPASKENIEGINEVLSIASKLNPINEETAAYMMKSGMEPTISNIYKAEHSAAVDNRVGSQKVIYGGAATYATAAQTEEAWDQIGRQVEGIIDRSGYDDTEEIRADAKWLIEHQIPLTEDSLREYEELKGVELPASNEVLMSAMTAAVLDGKSPADANLTITESLYDKAVRIINDFANADDRGDITKRRQLEEIRLAMTVEANITLLRKGIAIDTTDLQELVGMLKDAEAEFYKPLLLDSNASLKSSQEALASEAFPLSERIDVFKQSMDAVVFLRNAPVKTIGDVIVANDEFTIERLDVTGRALVGEYEKANQRYETMMTAPRADMGDSIIKAFANVDDILSDLDEALSDTNRKAVRIMGYSEIEMTKENLDKIRDAAQTVEKVIDLMTPARTLKMIREGHNPLTENLYELEQELKKETVEESSEKYSEFLFKLERRGEITPDEKSAFIGIYRLFDKIERKDSRTIGKVLKAGEELNLKNLLSAYRTGRLNGIDVDVDDDFGLIQDVISKGESITDQIYKGFKEITKQEAPIEYIKDRMTMIDEAAGEATSEKLLNDLEMPITVENILAASDFTKARRSPFRKLSDIEGNERVQKALKNTITAMTDTDSANAAYEEFLNETDEMAKTRMVSSEGYEDVKEWARLHKQIAIASEMARHNEYEVPVETEAGMVSVHLKLIQSDDREGKVEVSFETERYGQIRSIFSVKENKVSGIVTAQYSGGFEILREKEEDIVNELKANDFTVGDIAYVKVGGEAEAQTVANGNAANTQLYRVAKAFLAAMGKGVTANEG